MTTSREALYEVEVVAILNPDLIEIHQTLRHAYAY